MHRYETHLPVASTEASAKFHVDIVGLELAYRDPDGHSLEFISLLDDPPEPTFIGPLSAWQKKKR